MFDFSEGSLNAGALSTANTHLGASQLTSAAYFDLVCVVPSMQNACQQVASPPVSKFIKSGSSGFVVNDNGATRTESMNTDSCCTVGTKVALLTELIRYKLLPETLSESWECIECYGSTPVKPTEWGCSSRGRAAKRFFNTATDSCPNVFNPVRGEKYTRILSYARNERVFSLN